MNEQEKEQEIRMILNEDGWPNWPFLPVKKRGEFKVGVLFASGETNDLYELYENGNIFAPTAEWGESRKITVQQLVEEGWVGD